MKIHFITGNKNKMKEAQSLIPELVQLNVDLSEIQSLDSREVIRKKLREAQKSYDGPFVVEDTAFHLDCLGGLPGPFAKWFLESVGNHGLFDITKKYDSYDAHFKAIVGYCCKNGKIDFFEGVVYGKVVAPQGDAGFGLDPIFVPKGYTQTFAEMSIEEKNKISHRRQAFQKLQNFLHKQ